MKIITTNMICERRPDGVIEFHEREDFDGEVTIEIAQEMLGSGDLAERSAWSLVPSVQRDYPPPRCLRR